jgi:glycerophosphoryl diester phosphodiesterase
MSHRGYKKDYPENTLKSLESARDLGFEWVELDLVSTKDNVVICSHNFDLETETNGKGYVFNFLYDDLKILHTGVNSFPQKFERIPQLEEVFKSLSNSISYNLEIKTMSMFDLRTVKSLLSIIKDNKIKNFMISSFNPMVILYLKLFCFKVNTAFLVESNKYLWLVNWLHPDFLNPRADMLTDDLIRNSKKHKYGLIVWTVNSRMGIEYCIEKNVQSVITDCSLSN